VARRAVEPRGLEVEQQLADGGAGGSRSPAHRVTDPDRRVSWIHATNQRLLVCHARIVTDPAGDHTPLSARQLNRATLERQLLRRREALPVPDAVRRVVALQAQEPASPYLALWNRIGTFDPAGLDAAFTSGSVVKASLMRFTLHAVHADDYPTFHEVMTGRLWASRLDDTRSSITGVPIAESDALLRHLVEFLGRPRMKAEIEAFLQERLGDRGPGAWSALRTFTPLLHAPTGETWSFGLRPSFVAAPTRPRPLGAESALRHLVRRYLEGFGPASIPDIAQFALLQRTVVRQAVESMAEELVELEGPGRAKLYDLPGAQLPPEDATAPPRLLPMWDSVLLAYSDRSRLIPPEYRPLITRQNGDTLPTLLVDGYVAGVWRPVEGGIEATAFHALSSASWDGLAGEAQALIAFLAERDPKVYRRYGHWWAKLPSAEVRLLPG